MTPSFDRLRPGPSGVLLLLSVVFAAVLLIELAHTETPVTVGTAKPPAIAAPTTAPASGMPPLGALAEVVARPMFLPSRRPAPLVSAAAAAAPATRFTLSGIVVAGGRPLALIQDGTEAPPVRVTLGGTVDGWIVTAIAGGRVSLRNGDATAELSLRDNAPPYRVPSAPVTPPRRP